MEESKESRERHRRMTKKDEIMRRKLNLGGGEGRIRGKKGRRKEKKKENKENSINEDRK